MAFGHDDRKASSRGFDGDREPGRASAYHRYIEHRHGPRELRARQINCDSEDSTAPWTATRTRRCSSSAYT